MDEEEEPEDTPFFIQLAQLAEDKKDIKSEDVATFMKFLLSRLEGLDATPDGMDKGRKGPWIFYVDDDAHEQFKAAYGDKLQTVLSGVPHEFGVTYGTLADQAPCKSSAIRSSLKEIATYIVFRIFDPVKAYKTKTRHLASALEREGFHVLRGNQQRAKTALEGIVKVESGGTQPPAAHPQLAWHGLSHSPPIAPLPCTVHVCPCYRRAANRPRANTAL